MIWLLVSSITLYLSSYNKHQEKILHQKSDNCYGPFFWSNNFFCSKNVLAKKNLVINLPATLQTLSRHVPENFLTTLLIPSKHITDTLQTGSRHHPYTFQTPFIHPRETLQTSSIHPPLQTPLEQFKGGVQYFLNPAG